MRRHLFVPATFVFAALSTASWSTARAVEPVCGKHEHVVVETDNEEGGTVRRCVCDDGWAAEGPNKPCRKIKAGKDAAPAKKPKPQGGE